jgi:hypothetical protein
VESPILEVLRDRFNNSIHDIGSVYYDYIQI